MPLEPVRLLILAAAVVPPVVFSLLVLRIVRPPAPWLGGAAVAFLWGAMVAATLAAIANDLLLAWAEVRLGLESSRAIVPPLVGPVVEEILKATGFLAVAAVARPMLASVRGSVVAGALIGLGFAAVENVGYYTIAAFQGGYAGLARAVFLRGGVEGLNHAVFTAAAGGMLGLSARQGLTRSRVLRAAIAGVALAIAIHAVWNGAASPAIAQLLCNAPPSAAACAPAPSALDLFVEAPLLVLLCIGPPALTLVWLARRERDAHQFPSTRASRVE